MCIRDSRVPALDLGHLPGLVVLSGRRERPPAIAADGTIYVTCLDSRFYTFDQNGVRVRSLLVGGSIRSSPAIAEDGTVYFGAADGKLYAVKGSSPLASSPWPMYQRDLRHSGSGFQLQFGGFSIYPGGAVQLTLAVERGRAYQVEASSDFKLWAPVTNVVSTNLAIEILDNSGAGPVRFYRARTR